ncbi:hypothetical protein BDV93DRAFT_500994 [Ceratobasidium sp. AG-I]|nr:hypothetical protein BDV93DRAFT_500994 [Ceratobasidium sp. AG-I]
MASKLSHELIHQILSLSGVCTVEDKVFIDSSPLSHTMFLDRPIQASIILVSRHWLRVGTPLVYETILLHSQKQARALLYALRKTPSLGVHVRKLRLHGGFGLSMEYILRACPRITDLFISLFLSSKDNVLGLCAGLSNISPTRIIIHDPPLKYRTNKSTNTLAQKLCDCIPQWSKLKTVHFSYNTGRVPEISAVLCSRRGGQAGAPEGVQYLRVKHISDLKSLYYIAKMPMDNTQAIYSQTPLDPHLFDVPSLHSMLSDPMARRKLWFPLPGPWVRRPFVSLAEVTDMWVTPIIIGIRLNLKLTNTKHDRSELYWKAQSETNPYLGWGIYQQVNMWPN